MADPRYLPPDFDERRPPALGSGGLFFFQVPLPLPGRVPALPDADLHLLPATLYLDMPPSIRPRPCLAYGPPGLMAEAFRAGCADYLRDPWGLEELTARAGRFERFSLSLEGRLVRVSHRRLACLGRRVSLGEAEYRAFWTLAWSLNAVVPRSALRPGRIPGQARTGPDSRAPDVLVSSLRRKLRTLDPGLPGALRSIRGQGYLLVGDACG